MPASDSLNRLRHAGGMILTEHGLRLAKEGDHGRSVQRPRLLMLRNGCYRVGGRTFGSLDEALRLAAVDVPRVADAPAARA